MTDIFRRVPYAPDPTAAPYHSAHDYALMKSAKTPAKFACWYVDNFARKLTVPEAWEGAPQEVKAS